jgi:hypothetical protein
VIIKIANSKNEIKKLGYFKLKDYMAGWIKDHEGIPNAVEQINKNSFAPIDRISNSIIFKLGYGDKLNEIIDFLENNN